MKALTEADAASRVPLGGAHKDRRRFLDLLWAVRPFKVIVTQRRRRRWAAAAPRARVSRAACAVLRRRCAQHGHPDGGRSPSGAIRSIERFEPRFGSITCRSGT
jgi:hypothetical protein